MTILDRMQHCQQHLDTLLARYLPCSSSLSLFSAIRYSALAGGKRLRPLFVYSSAALFDVPQSMVDPIAAAIECIHCYSLIHDDLPAMDNDDFRRGKPTCHKQFNEATAILAGDGLLTLAFEILTHEDSISSRIIHLIAKAAGIHGMVKGQALDLTSENQMLTLSQLMDIHQAKTGALITASILAGAMISPTLTQNDEAHLRAFGEAIGLAFQIQDDILDEVGDLETMGKQPHQDHTQHKCTFVTLLGLEEAKKQSQLYYEKALNALTPFGNKADPLRELSAFIIQRAM